MTSPALSREAVKTDNAQTVADRECRALANEIIRFAHQHERPEFRRLVVTCLEKAVIAGRLVGIEAMGEGIRLARLAETHAERTNV